MVKEFGRFDGREAEIDIDGVTFNGTDFKSILREAEACLLTCGDYFLQILTASRLPICSELFKKMVYFSPALRIELEVDLPRIVLQNKAEKAAEFVGFHKNKEDESPRLDE